MALEKYICSLILIKLSLRIHTQIQFINSFIEMHSGVSKWKDFIRKSNFSSEFILSSVMFPKSSFLFWLIYFKKISPGILLILDKKQVLIFIILSVLFRQIKLLFLLIYFFVTVEQIP